MGTQFEKFEKYLVSQFQIRFDGKIIRFVRFETFSIQLIRNSIFNSKNSRKINSKFVRFDSTPNTCKLQAHSWPKAYYVDFSSDGLHLLLLVLTYASSIVKTLKLESDLFLGGFIPGNKAIKYETDYNYSDGYRGCIKLFRRRTIKVYIDDCNVAHGFISRLFGQSLFYSK